MNKSAQSIMLLILGSTVTACSTHSVNSYLMPETPDGLYKETRQTQVSQLSIKAHSYMLADELVASLAKHALTGKIIVTRFVEQDTRQASQDSAAPLAQLGGQLEESFVYELNKRGYKITDFKLRPDILVSEDGDYAWSRQLADLSARVDAKYIVSGTLTPHQNGAVVNVRMMEMANGLVLATAQGFLPNNLFWSEEKVTTRDGMLIHKGESDRIVGGDNENYF
mgnify:CR=1 FL=1